MNGKRLLKIEFESIEKTVLRFRPPATTNIFCRECRENAPHFSVSQAALVLSLPETAIFRATESGQIHSMEAASGALMVCGNSVSELANKIDFEKLGNK